MPWNEALRESRFWAKVQKTDGCWLWLGDRTAGGYGVLRVRYSRQYAHRFVLTLLGRPALPDQVVCHHCDNPPCVNPDHLFVGTHADNVADKLRKGRGRTSPKITGQCRRGHQMTPDNTALYRTADGVLRPRCRKCHNLRAADRRTAVSRSARPTSNVLTDATTTATDAD